jgi:hypothetical protein
MQKFGEGYYEIISKTIGYVAWGNKLIHVLISNRANGFRQQSF